MKWICSLVVVALALTAWSKQETVEFNYTGRVRVKGKPFTGEALFKFALVNEDGTTTYWSNDGTAQEGGEPQKAIILNCVDGFFSVAVGDPLIGMKPLLPLVFNESERVYLRVWFNDGARGFQRLAPDRRVVNPALLADQSFDSDVTLFVDAQRGDNGNNGLTSGTAKASIQGAIDLLPARAKGNVTIRVAPGVYREHAQLTGLNVSADAKLSLIGDETWGPTLKRAPRVRITGVDRDKDAPARAFGLTVTDCAHVRVVGFQIDGVKNRALSIGKSSQVDIDRCLAQDSVYGFVAERSIVTFTRCVARSNREVGFLLANQSRFELEDCEVTGSDAAGLLIHSATTGVSRGCRFLRNKLRGVYIVGHSSLELSGHRPTLCNHNGEAGLRADGFAHVVTIGVTPHQFNHNGRFGLWADGYSYIETASQYQADHNGSAPTRADVMSTIGQP